MHFSGNRNKKNLLIPLIVAVGAMAVMTVHKPALYPSEEQKRVHAEGQTRNMSIREFYNRTEKE